MPDDIRDLDLAEVLGAKKEPSVQQLTLYIPNKDKDGGKIKRLRVWIKEAKKLLTIIGEGSTTMPPADGTWLKNQDIKTMKGLRDEDILWEKTTVMYTYIYPDRFEDQENLSSLREFLHRFGRETNQGEVVFEYDGKFYRIDEYDPE
jgi:hypothetical protein